MVGSRTEVRIGDVFAGMCGMHLIRPGDVRHVANNIKIPNAYRIGVDAICFHLTWIGTRIWMNG